MQRASYTFCPNGEEQKLDVAALLSDSGRRAAVNTKKCHLAINENEFKLLAVRVRVRVCVCACVYPTQIKLSVN